MPLLKAKEAVFYDLHFYHCPGPPHTRPGTKQWVLGSLALSHECSACSGAKGCLYFRSVCAACLQRPDVQARLWCAFERVGVGEGTDDGLEDDRRLHKAAAIVIIGKEAYRSDTGVMGRYHLWSVGRWVALAGGPST